MSILSSREAAKCTNAPAYTGWDVIIVRDGRIAALYVFLDEATEEFHRTNSQPVGG